MDVTIRFIRWECSCGMPRNSVLVGVSSLGELVAKWTCQKCGKEVMARMKLEDLIRDIPTPVPQICLPPATYTQEDLKLLRAMHIGEPDESHT